MSILGEECAIQINLGVRNLDGSVTYNGMQSIHGIAKRVSIKDSVEKKDGKAMGDARKKFRATAGEGEITIDTVTQVSGYYFAGTTTPIGMIATFQIKEISSLSSYRAWTCLVTEWESNVNDGEITMEKITLASDAG